MAIVEDCIKYGVGDPKWNFSYMQQCLTRWEIYVRGRAIEYEPTKICPLVQKGAGGVIYVPWAQMDKEGLQTNLPALMNGAGKWIACLEKNTAGINLAIGNIKNLLNSLIGDQTNIVLTQAQIPAITLKNAHRVPNNRVPPSIGRREGKMHHTLHRRDQVIGTLDSSSIRQGTWQ